MLRRRVAFPDLQLDHLLAEELQQLQMRSAQEVFQAFDLLRVLFEELRARSRELAHLHVDDLDIARLLQVPLLARQLRFTDFKESFKTKMDQQVSENQKQIRDAIKKKADAFRNLDSPSPAKHLIAME